MLEFNFNSMLYKFSKALPEFLDKTQTGFFRRRCGEPFLFVTKMF